MPNYCNYSMCVAGTKESVEEFIKVIKADYDYGAMQFSYDRHLFRVFEAESSEVEEYGDGKFRAIINGYCAWSVSSCMLESGYYRRSKEKYGPLCRGTTLWKTICVFALFYIIHNVCASVFNINANISNNIRCMTCIIVIIMIGGVNRVTYIKLRFNRKFHYFFSFLVIKNVHAQCHHKKYIDSLLAVG